MLPFESIPDEAHPQASTVTAEVQKPAESAVLLRPEEHCAFVIFGASGDLTSRKLIPALYNLACQKLLPQGFAVIGFAVTPMDDESFRKHLREWVMNSPEVIVFRTDIWEEFEPLLHYITGDFESPEGYQKLGERCEELDRDHRCGGNR